MERTVALKTVKRDKTYVDTDILFFFFPKSDIPWLTRSLVWEVGFWTAERRAGSAPRAGVCVCKGVGVCVHSCRTGECVCLCSGDSLSLALWP